MLSNENKNVLANHARRAISVTDLELYASCPFKYFVQSILKIKVKEPPELTMSNIEMGSYLHAVLYTFYVKLAEKQLQIGNYAFVAEPENKKFDTIVGVNLINEEHSNLEKMLFDAAHEELDKISQNYPFMKIDYEDIFGNEFSPGTLRTWLKSEYQNCKDKAAFAPALFEFSFGSADSHELLRQPVKLSEKLLLRGKIDRIELNQTTNPWYYLIADYKTTLPNQSGYQSALNGTAFQVSLYMAAFRSIWLDLFNTRLKSSGAVFYSIKPKFEVEKNSYKSADYAMIPSDSPLIDGELGAKIKRNRKEIISDKSSMDDLFHQSISHAEKILDNIAEGRFPVNPSSADSCNYCNYSRICRIKKI